MTAWAASTAYSVGDLRRQLATPTVGNERVFRCTTAGTSGGSEPSWNLGAGATTNDNTAVWTEVTGNATYGWTAPFARMQTANGRMAAGDTCWISHQHAETRSSSMVIGASAGTASAPCRFICVNDGATPPTTRATTATVSTTGGSDIEFQTGHAYVYGVTFSAAATNTAGDIKITVQQSATFGRWVFESCGFTIAGTGASQRIRVGPESGGALGGASTIWRNVVVRFAAVGQAIRACHDLFWIGGSVNASGSSPTNLLQQGTAARGRVDIVNVDLSHLGSGKKLVTSDQNASVATLIRDCKLGASVTITSAPAAPGYTPVRLVNCDSADTNYRYYRSEYQAVEQHETTIIRSGGANDGVTGISRKIVTASGVTPVDYYRSDPIEFWNSTVGGSVSLAIPVLTDGVTLTDAEAWIEVEYLGTSGYPLGLLASDRVADPIFGTPANQATDGSSSWTTTGLSSPVQQTLGVSVTPQEIGTIRVYICIAKASTTVYYDPKVLATSGRQYQGAAAFLNEGASGGGSTAIFVVND